jgi:hypothetical protein
MFAGLLFLIFPELKQQGGLQERLTSMSPDLGSIAVVPCPPVGLEEVINTAILINLHEVKALILEALLRPLAIAHAQPCHRPRVARVIDQLISDEISHIRYTATFIESAVQNGYRDYVSKAMVGFQALLNDSTLREVERTNQSCEQKASVA